MTEATGSYLRRLMNIQVMSLVKRT